MKTLQIRTYSDPILRQKCTNVPRDYDIKDLVQTMRNTLDQTEYGVGLAASQVGVPLRVFLGPENIAFINFEILALKGGTKSNVESCLSLPGVSGLVKRYRKVRIKWYDEDWNLHERTFKNFQAILIQHEVKHVNGSLYIDEMAPNERKALEKIIHVLEQKEHIYEYKEFMEDWVKIEEFKKEHEPGIGGLISIDTRDFKMIASLAGDIKENMFIEPNIDDSEYMTINQVKERLLDWRTKVFENGSKYGHINYVSENGSYWYKYIRIHETKRGYVWCNNNNKFNSTEDLEKHITFKM